MINKLTFLIKLNMDNGMFKIELNKYINKFTNGKNRFSQLKEGNELEELKKDLCMNNPLDSDEVSELIEYIQYNISGQTFKNNIELENIFLYTMGKDSVIGDLLFFSLIELSINEKGEDTNLSKKIQNLFGI